MGAAAQAAVLALAVALYVLVVTRGHIPRVGW
jgi:hypothetical protein